MWGVTKNNECVQLYLNKTVQSVKQCRAVHNITVHVI